LVLYYKIFSYRCCYKIAIATIATQLFNFFCSTFSEANNTIQSIHHKGGAIALTTPSDDVANLQKEVGELRERVADLQSDKMLIEEELKEAQAGRDEVEVKSAKVHVQAPQPILNFLES